MNARLVPAAASGFAATLLVACGGEAPRPSADAAPAPTADRTTEAAAAQVATDARARAATEPGAATNDAAVTNAPRPPWFRECAHERGLVWRHRFGTERRFDFPEIMGGGVALFDYDADGDLDVYLVQSGDLLAPTQELAANALFQNDGTGRFVDVTARAGVGDVGYGMGATIGDYDADGDLDLFVTNVGPNVLYRNRGDGTFEDVTSAAGVAGNAWSTSAGFVDVEGDGDLDLFVVDYIRWSRERERECRFPKDARDYCNPNAYDAPAPSVLYLNRGDGTFEDASERVGLTKTYGNGLGVTAGDFDGDGRVEVYVANDMRPNLLWCWRDGGLIERALLAGCSLNGTGFAASGMGVQAVDVENDGDLDLFVTNLRRQSNTLYLNGGKFFADATARFGLSAPSLPHTAFGLGFHDFDHDGRVDLYIANGDVVVGDPPERADDPYAQTNSLYRQKEDGRFEELDPQGGTEPRLVHTSRGAAFGDLDGDGDVDAVVVNRDSAPYLLLNEAPKRGRWVILDVRDRRDGPAIGARVELRAGGKTYHRLVQPAYSYCSASDPRVHFGLGSAERIESVKVRFADGSDAVAGELALDRVHVISSPGH
ncbi:MAG: CRTAC1 family protein [Planctomycetes bacterium]|nr:CRTAC1 family protein [Planctomycetota bacterium]